MSVVPDYVHQFMHKNAYTAMVAIRSGIIVDINNVCCKLLGYERDDVIERRVADMLQRKPRHKVSHQPSTFLTPALADAFRTYSCIKADKSIIFVKVSVAYRDPHSRLLVLTVTDATYWQIHHRMLQQRHSLLDAIKTDIFWQIDMDSTVMYVSDSIAAFGLPAEEYIGKSILDFMPEDEKDRARALFSPDSATTAQVVHEIKLDLPDGKTMWLEASGNYVFDGNTPVRLEGIAKDITSRKLAEKSLIESEQRYRGIIESQESLIIRTTPDGMLTFANDACYRMFQVNPGDVLGTSYIPFIHPDDVAVTVAAVDSLRHPPHRCTVVHRADTVHGWRWLLWENCAILDQSGNIVELQGVGRDFTEQRRASEDLRRSEQRNRAMLRAIPDLLLRIRRDGAFLDSISMSDIQLTVKPAGFLGRTVTDVFPQCTANQFLRAIESALETGDTQHIEYSLNHDDEIKYYEARLVVSAENEVLAIVRDITLKKLTEDAVRQANADLARAYALQRDFINNVTHEIRTPLTAIQGYAEMLLEGIVGNLNKEQAALLRKMLTCSDNLLQIVGSLLELARLKSGKLVVRPRVCDPSRIVDKAVSAVLPQANQKSIKVNVDLPKRERVGTYDEEKLTMIVTNIVANAVKFSDHGEVNISVEACSAGVQIVVADSGMGIADDQLPTIFDEFTQLAYPRKHKPSGFGLGLSIVATMVDAIGAKLTVSSASGIGTAFTLFAPEIDMSANQD